MKERLSLRIETTRLDKLKRSAAWQKKTITHVIEDLIDTLPEPPKLDDGQAG